MYKPPDQQQLLIDLLEPEVQPTNAQARMFRLATEEEIRNKEIEKYIMRKLDYKVE